MPPHHRTAHHEFVGSALPDDTFRVIGFAGTETISQPYEFGIELVSNDPDIAFADIIDLPATLTMYRGDEPTEINGIVVDFMQEQMNDAETDYRYTYRAVLVPRLHRLSLSFQSRVFQHLTVEEIVSRVLDEAGVDYEFQLAESYEPREYCTQYKETDLQFVQRLLEFEGIRYYFTHADGSETLILSDDPSDAPSIDDPAALQYRVERGRLRADGSEQVIDFVARQQLVTGRTTVRDYNYRTPETSLHSESELNGDQAVGVHADYGLNVGTPSRGDRLARIRNEEIESTRLVMTGAGDCLRFRSGHRFELQDHYRSSLNQEYLITGVQHTGTRAGPGGAQSPDLSDYQNSFTCVPASVPYRPPRLTPEPKLPGVMTARVESGGGEYAYIDDDGRYRVRMPFDPADSDTGGATKPIRLAQPYSGSGYGMHFPVHADAEMVFACVDGNVDRPLGLSTVPNPSQGSPVTSGNRTMNRIVTAADNRIEIEDEAGNERIKLSTPRANSIIQLGSPNLPQSGIGISTDDSFQAYGEQGVVLTAGGGYVADASINSFKDGLTTLDGAISVAKALTGGPKMGTLAGVSVGIASTIAGIVWPGVYIAGQGGIGMYSQNGINSLAGPGGIGLNSLGGGIDLAATTGISLLNAAGGISMATGMGGVDIHASVGDVEIEADTGDLLLKSNVASTKTTSNRNVEITARVNTEIESGAENKFESDGNTYIKSKESNININADQNIMIESDKGQIGITSDQDITVASESGRVDITGGSGSSPNQPSVGLDGRYITAKAGSLFKAVAGRAGRSVIEVYPTNVNIRVGNNSIRINETGITISALTIDLSGRAKAALKAALTEVG